MIMKEQNAFDVVIVGGSYSGLSAAMALGRGLRNTLVIDSGKPANAKAPHSHNFITQDGNTPSAIALLAREQTEQYPSIKFVGETAVKVSGNNNQFIITTAEGNAYNARKIIFAAGIKDVMPELKGFEACWGVSIIHCPYCHGYEVRNEATGILANGDMAFEMARMISNWTPNLMLLTNGKSTLTPEQTTKIKSRNIQIEEKTVSELLHSSNGHIHTIQFNDGSAIRLNVLYSRPSFMQHTDVPEQLGCSVTEQGYLTVDAFQKTTIAGVFACGDATTPMRSVANAVAAGSLAGVMVNKELIEEDF
jgi:thioredoxin reductase